MSTNQTLCLKVKLEGLIQFTATFINILLYMTFSAPPGIEPASYPVIREKINMPKSMRQLGKDTHTLHNIYETFCYKSESKFRTLDGH